VRHLHKHACTITGVHLTAARTTMVQIAQNLNSLLEDLVRFAAFNINDEANAAGVVLELRVV
jgi:hypothetical protein